jgi:hypothetical protein
LDVDELPLVEKSTTAIKINGIFGGVLPIGGCNFILAQSLRANPREKVAG